MEKRYEREKKSGRVGANSPLKTSFSTVPTRARRLVVGRIPYATTSRRNPGEFRADEFREDEHVIEFLALRAIAAGEELTVNYNNLGELAANPLGFDVR